MTHPTQTGIEEAWADVAAFVPKLAAALAVFIIGWIIARIIRSAIERVLTAVKFDQWVDKAGLGQSVERAGFADSGKLLAKLIYWAVLLITLQLAVDTFGDSAITEALDGIVGDKKRALSTLVLGTAIKRADCRVGYREIVRKYPQIAMKISSTLFGKRITGHRKVVQKFSCYTVIARERLTTRR